MRINHQKIRNFRADDNLWESMRLVAEAEGKTRSRLLRDTFVEKYPESLIKFGVNDRDQ